ncbi:MAG TPA: hypothetical protein VGM23_09220, partial [Armatimonadota bacterium]
YFKSYDSDSNHASGVTSVLGNNMSFIWQLGKLVQKATVYGYSMGAVYDSKANKTTIGTGATLTGGYELTLTFIDPSNIEKDYRQL